ncbi:MAG: hypothetical protein P4L65_01190 [Legionella sp.]|nr:hypothetical protein [Legionella sp.]
MSNQSTYAILSKLGITTRDNLVPDIDNAIADDQAVPQLTLSARPNFGQAITNALTPSSNSKPNPQR